MAGPARALEDPRKIEILTTDFETMTEERIFKVVRYTRDNLPPDKTDWARLDAMTDEEVIV